MFIRKIASSTFAVHKVRVALTVAAVALSVSLVVSVTSGYSSLEEAAIKFLTRFMGSTDALIGREALVLSAVTRDGGRVRLNGAEWSARTRDPNQELAAGTRVSVVGIDGATAIVWQDPFA